MRTLNSVVSYKKCTAFSTTKFCALPKLNSVPNIVCRFVWYSCVHRNRYVDLVHGLERSKLSLLQYYWWKCLRYEPRRRISIMKNENNVLSYINASFASYLQSRERCNYIKTYYFWGISMYGLLNVVKWIFVPTLIEWGKWRYFHIP